MLEVYGNLWEYPARIIVITTNGSINKDGLAVMERGCAKEAADRFPNLRKELARYIKIYGLHTMPLQMASEEYDNALLVSFPVKFKWNQKANLNLIEQSTKELVETVSYYPNLKPIVMPRPGCGNGGLSWEQVKPVIAPILDDRFHVITF